MSSLSVYLLGFIVLTFGIAMGMHLAGIPATWIGAFGVFMLGLGLLMGVTKTRRRESSPME